MGVFQIFKNKPIITISLLILLALLVDLSNIDSELHKVLCLTLGKVFRTICPDFYDLPIWEVAVAFGTLTAAYYAYTAIKESNRRLRLEQEPDVRIKDRVQTAMTPNSSRLHLISLKNYGKGRAVNITATADPEGKISIIDGSNPNCIDLGPADINSGWAIDESQVIKGLAKQGIIVKSVVKEVPDEKKVQEDEKHKADFNLYLWYEDQLGTKYKTRTKIRNSGGFFKVMENKVETL